MKVINGRQSRFRRGLATEPRRPVVISERDERRRCGKLFDDDGRSCLLFDEAEGASPRFAAHFDVPVPPSTLPVSAYVERRQFQANRHRARIKAHEFSGETPAIELLGRDRARDALP